MNVVRGIGVPNYPNSLYGTISMSIYNSTLSTEIQNKFKPTWLYIKQHSVTGLKYFGKTCKKDPYRYRGSGKYWIKHITKHGKNQVDTIWCRLFTDKRELMEYAIRFSVDNNIVQSSDWANLKVENGLDGGGIKGMGKGKAKTAEHKMKCSRSLKGRKFDQQWKNNLSNNHANVAGSNNPRARKWKVTSPQGIITIVDGTMTQFCNQNSLPASVMRSIGRTRIHPKTGKCVGWDVEVIEI